MLCLQQRASVTISVFKADGVWSTLSRNRLAFENVFKVCVSIRKKVFQTDTTALAFQNSLSGERDLLFGLADCGVKTKRAKKLLGRPATADEIVLRKSVC